MHYVEGKPLEGQVAYQVEAYLSVFNRTGDPISDLSASDFTASEDSKKVVINTSSAVYVPAGLAHFPQIWKNVQRPVMTMVIMPTSGEKEVIAVPLTGRMK
jgi:hypothetical protein